jgi:hypothetical protein
MFKLIIALTIGLAAASCPNGCSGNGICGANDKCSCHQNWQGSDCSLRACTATLAWADTADGTNQAHYYAECGNKGVCDRKTGECKCFDGYEGKGCRRSTCPEGCSGHGTCEYIEELAGDFYDRRTGPGNQNKDFSCKDNRQFPSKSGAASTGGIELFDMAVDDKVITVTQAITTTANEGSFDAAAFNGMAVVYKANYATAPTALFDGRTYYILKHSTADNFLVVTTYKLATATYADDAAKIAVALDVKAGTVDGEASHTFTHANQDACHAQALETSNVVSRSANTDIYNGQQYQLWDAGKIQGCRCDLGYDGPDCSHRISPHGDDPLTTVKANMMKQAVKVDGAASTLFIRQQFIMVYHDPYGGIWRTDAIDGTNDDDVAASRVQDALRALPNEVLEGVKVTSTSSTPSICHRFDDGIQHLSAFEDNHIGHHKDSKYSSNFCEHSHTELATHADDMDFTIEFANLPGQTGVQYLFEVDVSKRGAGAFPMSGGITGASTYSVGEINYNANLGNLSELAECSDRGLDDGDGQCECFDGFRGLACEEQEALV